MTAKTLNDRREALEESFFRKENEKLLNNLREKEEREHRREALGDAMAYHDDSLLDLFLDVGLRAETWLAITLVPLVEVAWADREITRAERDVILEAAEEHGIDAGSAARSLLEHWLDHRPTPHLREAWAAYVSAIRESLGSAELEALQKDTLTRARNVAKATNNVLGIGRQISDVEGEVLAELENALS